MERVFVNSVVTQAFFLLTGTTRCRVHFFPSAGTTAGHYPVGCELSIFGKGVEKRAVQLEGGRLNQPDGIRLEDAFPTLGTEASGLCGLRVRLSCPQGRVNLLKSRVVVEIVSPQFSLVFNSASCKPDLSELDEGPEDAGNEGPQFARSGIATCDSFSVPSLVLVNGGSELERPDVRHLAREMEAPLHLGTVAAESVVEFPLEEALCKQGLQHAALWGDVMVERFWGEERKVHSDLSWYLMHRDPVMRRPISVCAL